jgi:CYTH domain-containing protein
MPAWVGREVTDDAAFYNLSLALNGLPEGVR